MKTKEKFILHDHNKDGLDRRGFLKCQKLPELARGLGAGIKEFKKAAGNASEEMRQPQAKPDAIAPAQTNNRL